MSDEKGLNHCDGHWTRSCSTGGSSEVFSWFCTVFTDSEEKKGTFIEFLTSSRRFRRFHLWLHLFLFRSEVGIIILVNVRIKVSWAKWLSQNPVESKGRNTNSAQDLAISKFIVFPLLLCCRPGFGNLITAWGHIMSQRWTGNTSLGYLHVALIH